VNTKLLFSIFGPLTAILLLLFASPARGDQTQIICVDCDHELAQIDNVGKTLYVRQSSAATMNADFQMVRADDPDVGIESWWQQSEFDWELSPSDLITSITPGGLSRLDTTNMSAAARPVGSYTYTLSCEAFGNDHEGSPADETKFFTVYLVVSDIAIDSIYTIAYASDASAWDEANGWSFPAVTYLSGSGLDNLIFKQYLNLSTQVYGWNGSLESRAAVLAEFPGLPNEFVDTNGFDVADSGLTPDWTDLTDFWVSNDGTQAEILDDPQSLSLPTFDVSMYYLPVGIVPNEVVKRFDSGGTMKMRFEYWSGPNTLDYSVGHDWGYWWTNSNSFWFTNAPPTINVPGHADGFFEYCAGGTRWNPGEFANEFGFTWN
jgi:hypothetical protein